MDSSNRQDAYKIDYPSVFLSPMAILFLHRYQTNVLDVSNHDRNELDPEALEIPLKLISKDIDLLISTYHSLRSAYAILKQQCDSQRKQLESILFPRQNPIDREASLLEWEDSLRTLQEEWSCLQNAVDQASWSLFVLSQRKDKPNSEVVENLHIEANAPLDSSYNSIDLNQSQLETLRKQVEKMKVSAEQEILDMRKRFTEEIDFKKKEFEIEIENIKSSELSKERYYKTELETKQNLISFLEQKVDYLESELNTFMNDKLHYTQRDDSRNEAFKDELESIESSLRQDFEANKIALEQKIELEKSALMRENELKKTLLINEFESKKHHLENEMESLKIHCLSEFETLKNNLESEFYSKNNAVNNFEKRLKNSLSQLSVRENAVVARENQLTLKEQELSHLQNQLSGFKESTNISLELDIEKSELKALSMHLEDIKQKLMDEEAQFKTLEKNKLEEFNSREAILTSMEASLLARIKDEEATIIARNTAQAAELEDLKKKKSLLEADRATLEADTTALVSLTSLLEERKTAIEASLLAQSEAIENERSRLLTDQTLFENQRKQFNPKNETEDAHSSREKISLLQITLKQLEDEKKQLFKSKSCTEDKSFLSTEEIGYKTKPTHSQSKANRQHLLLSPINSRYLTASPRLFKSPDLKVKHSGGLSQSFRRMLSKLVTSESLKKAKKVNNVLKDKILPSSSINIFDNSSEYSSDQAEGIPFDEIPNALKVNHSYNISSELSSLSYAGISGSTDELEESSAWDSESTPVASNRKLLKGKAFNLGSRPSLKYWINFVSCLEQRVFVICKELKEERGRVLELTTALRDVEQTKLSSELKLKEYEEQYNLEKDKALHEKETKLAALKLQLQDLDSHYQTVISQLQETKQKLTHTEGKYNQLLKEKDEFSLNDTLLNECSSFLLSADSESDSKFSLLNDSDSISQLVKDNLVDLTSQKFTSSIIDTISDDTTTWLPLFENRLNSKIQSPKEAVDIFVYVVNSKISKMTQEIIRNSHLSGNDKAPLQILIAKILRKTANAVFLFSFGIFKALQSSSPNISSMLNERVQALEIALRSAEDEKKTLLRESAQNLQKIASLSNELTTKNDNKSAAYWKERCRSELDHRSDLVFQKRYLVLEITCLRSNEQLLLSLLDQLSETIPSGMLSPTPGIMSPMKATASFSASSFIVVARSVLACIRWGILTKKRSKRFAVALSR